MFIAASTAKLNAYEVPRKLRDDGKEIGQRIRTARERAGLTQNEVARTVGLADGQAIWRYESGSSTPKGHNAAALAKSLGVSLDWLMYGEASTAQASSVPPENPAVAESLESFLRSPDPCMSLITPEIVGQLRHIVAPVRLSHDTWRSIALDMLRASSSGASDEEKTATIVRRRRTNRPEKARRYR